MKQTLRNLIELFTTKKGLFFKFLKTEIKQKYAGSVLGLLWLVLFPLLFFAAYSSVYLFIFKVQPENLNRFQYVLYIMSGLVPFLGFAEALAVSTDCLVAKKAVLFNTVYPSELLPLQAVVSSHTTSMVGFVLIFLMHLFMVGLPGWRIVFVPLVLIMQMLFVSGLGWILALINLVFKDIKQLLPLITLVLMIMTPIAYTPAMVPQKLRFILWLNPFAYFVSAYQSIVVYHVFNYAFYVAIIIGLSTSFLGFYIFSRLRTVMYDYV